MVEAEVSINDLEKVNFQAGQLEYEKKVFLARIGNLDSILAKEGMTDDQIDQYVNEREYLRDKYDGIVTQFDGLLEKRTQLNSELNSAIKAIRGNVE